MPFPWCCKKEVKRSGSYQEITIKEEEKKETKAEPGHSENAEQNNTEVKTENSATEGTEVHTLTDADDKEKEAEEEKKKEGSEEKKDDDEAKDS